MNYVLDFYKNIIGKENYASFIKMYIINGYTFLYYFLLNICKNDKIQ